VNIKNVAFVPDSHYTFNFDPIKDFSPSKNLLNRTSVEINRGTPISPNKKGPTPSKLIQADNSAGK